MERTMLLVMKAVETRLAALKTPVTKYTLPDGWEAVPLADVEKIRGDLFLAILELEEKVK